MGFSKGDTVTVDIIADDGTDTTTVSGPSLVIDNTPPEAPTLAITPSSPGPGDSLWCEVVTDSPDADEDAITYTITWTVDGVDYAVGGTTDTGGLDSGASGWAGPTTTTWTDDTTDGDDVWSNETWTCTATPNDGDDDGTPASVSVDTNCNDASASTCPGLDCLDILTTDPTAPDDIYWIDPTGSDAYEVFCDMTTDGGGWTLVMKAVNDNFLYVDPVWSTTGLANETDLSLTTSGTAKYQSYNEVPFTELRTSDNTVLTTDLVESFSTTQTSALALFSSSGTVLDTIHNSYFDSRAPSAYQAWGCTELNRYGLNLADALGCTYQSGSGGFLCDHNGGARWGNRTNQYYCSSCGELHGQGWAAYGCSSSSEPSVDTGPQGAYLHTINELMWVR
ncbi:MAG: hypothetical protein CL927_18020 [Deltaproteobacteria bacterium]|nr:hypothetical protein [Deltaproteobacteria bacterium]